MSEDIVVLSTQVEKRFAPSNATSVEAAVPVQVDRELEGDIGQIPAKLAFKIGEVADLVGVKAYVLRYWESEFGVLRPKKSKHGQRMYERKDVENLLLIKKLLYRDRFSIEGARSALKKLRKDNVRVKQMKTVVERIAETKDRVQDLLSEIEDFRTILR